MKKFIFSAVAMIAFVGSSMASDIAEKEVRISIEQDTQINNYNYGGPFVEFKVVDCEERALLAYNKLKSLGASEYLQDEALMTVMLDCIYNG